MSNGFKKVFFRQIKDTKSRFISILLISALGVGFFVGVKAASPSMKYSADKFFDKNNLMDFRIMSDFGFVDDDIKALEDIKGVKQVMPSYWSDLLVKDGDANDVVRFHSVPESKAKETPINQLKVVEGRLPQSSGECVVESNQNTSKNYKIGDTVEVISPNEDTEITDIVKTNTFTVVGLVESPQYISFDKGISQVGDGSLLSYIMILASDFTYSRYTEVYVTVDTPKTCDSSFDKEYSDYIEEFTSKIENVADVQIEANRKQIVEEANESINSAKAQLEKQKQEQQAKLDEAAKEISDAENEIASNEQKIKDGEAEIEAGEAKIASSEAQIADGWNQIAAGEQQLQAGIEEYNAAVDEYNEFYSQYESQREVGQAQIDSGREQVEKFQAMLNALESMNITDDEQIQQQINSLQQQLNAAEAQIVAGEQLLAEADYEIAAAKQQLDASAAQIQASENEIENEKQNLVNAEAELEQGKQEIEKNKKEIEAGKAEIEEGKVKLEDSKKKLEEGQKAFDDKFKLAENNIKQKENEIASLSSGKWYIFTREDNPGYTSFAQDADRIDGIASIFPLFFFIVAALVCLTTMTRMVEEERTQIGTFKALGYENKTIAAKYFLYAFFATILGSILGTILGLLILPENIFHAYDVMYKIPYFSIKVSIPIIIIAIIVALLSTCTVAYIVANNELKLNPATLMRPKAPKQGKRILLEKIPFIWKRMNFSSKVTTRNIFRYKARFIMTVLGVAGCTALILAAYGLKDSISVVVPKQYGQIFTYDTMMNLKYEGTMDEKQNLESVIKSDNRIKSNLMVKQSIFNGGSNNEKDSVQVRLFVPESLEDFSNFVNLIDKKDGKDIELTNDNVVITEKLAKLLDLNVGDTISLFDDGDTNVELKIDGIAENYVYNYVYMSKELYEEKFGENLKLNAVLLKLTEDGKAHEDQVAEDWLEEGEILVVTSTSYLISNFEDMIKSLNSVVVLMIICAAALAFVVLYNLTNINVAERMREIATIKVLGFTDKESANYVYRENIVLSIIGIVLGLVIGIFLSNYIVSTIEMDMVMFGRNIKLLSFIYAAALTLVFTLLVNVAMYRKINNISMVESLKSVE